MDNHFMTVPLPALGSKTTARHKTTVLLSINQAFSGATAAEKLTITSALLDLKTPLLNLTAFQNSSQLRGHTNGQREGM